MYAMKKYRGGSSEKNTTDEGRALTDRNVSDVPPPATAFLSP